MAIIGDHSLDQEPSPLIQPGGAGCGLFSPHPTVEIGMDSSKTLTAAAKSPKSSADQAHIQAHKSGATLSKPSASQPHNELLETSVSKWGKGKGKSQSGSQSDSRSQSQSSAGKSVSAVQKSKISDAGIAIIVTLVLFAIFVGMVSGCFDGCDGCDGCDSCFEEESGVVAGEVFEGPHKGQFLESGEAVYYDDDDDVFRLTRDVAFDSNGKGYVDLDGDGERSYGESAYVYTFYYYDDAGKRVYVDEYSWDPEAEALYWDVDGDVEYSYKDKRVYTDLEPVTEENYIF